MMNEKSEIRTRGAALAIELDQMADRDQAMRRSGTFDSRVDVANTVRLKQIIEEIGWPTKSVVGARAAHHAWLIAQLADLDLPFQERVLALMKSCPPGEVQPSNVAYLQDRVCVAKGQPQIYGTQGFVSKGVWRPRPIAEEDAVDVRRSAVGLGPLHEYVEQCNVLYAKRVEEGG